MICRWWYVTGLLECEAAILHMRKTKSDKKENSGTVSHILHILTQKRNVRFTFMWIFSKWLQFFHWMILPQEMWLFNNAMRQKENHLMHIYGKDNAASTSTQIMKFKHIIKISGVFHLYYSPQHIPVSLNGRVAELLWEPGVFLAVTTTGISLSRKCDVTKCRSRPWKVIMRMFGSCRIICDVIDIKPFAKMPYCPGRCYQLSGYLNIVHNGLKHANIIFVDVIPLTERCSGIFFKLLRICLFNEVKFKCQISLSA